MASLGAKASVQLDLVLTNPGLDCKQSLSFFGIVEHVILISRAASGRATSRDLRLAPSFLAPACDIRIAHSTISKKNNECSQSNPRLNTSLKFDSRHPVCMKIMVLELRNKLHTVNALISPHPPLVVRFVISPLSIKPPSLLSPPLY